MGLDLEIELLKELQALDKRPSELKKKLYPAFKQDKPYSKLTEETFNTQLVRGLNKLVKNEEIEKRDRGHQNVSYSISIKGKRRLLTLDMSSYFSDLDKQNLEIWCSVFRQLREKNEDPTHFCFTFIGDVPVAFSKSMFMFQRHLEQEARLMQRHLSEIDRIKSEVYQVPPGEPQTFWKEEWREKLNDRIEKEVGWRLGDYFRKLHKKSENMEFEEKLILMGQIDEPTNNKKMVDEKNEK